MISVHLVVLENCKPTFFHMKFTVSNCAIKVIWSKFYLYELISTPFISMKIYISTNVDLHKLVLEWKL